MFSDRVVVQVSVNVGDWWKRWGVREGRIMGRNRIPGCRKARVVWRGQKLQGLKQGRKSQRWTDLRKGILFHYL